MVFGVYPIMVKCPMLCMGPIGKNISLDWIRSSYHGFQRYDPKILQDTIINLKRIDHLNNI